MPSPRPISRFAIPAYKSHPEIVSDNLRSQHLSHLGVHSASAQRSERQKESPILNSTINAVFRPERRRFVDWLRVFTLFTLAAIWSARPVISQQFDSSKTRELKIPSLKGEPSFSLQISAEGRKGVVAVRDEKGTEMQTLICPLLRDNIDVRQEELAAVREQFVTQFVVADFDSDGNLDLAGIREFGAKWARYCVWLYHPTQRTFIKDFLAEQMELLANLRPLVGGQISSSHLGPANNWMAVYQVADAKGGQPERQLVPLYSCSVDSTLDGEKPTAIVTTHYESGRAIARRQEIAKMDIRAALDRCSSGFQAGAAPRVLFLNRANEGQSVSAKVGQSIVITLQTIGPGQYGAPQVSSQSIRFESSSFPAKQNPGGPTQVYRFTAVAEGEAKIEITHSDGNGTFELTIQVARTRH